jgi:4-amino-4-deoxy-L-arabinose transferase-like glycosyltransferase
VVGYAVAVLAIHAGSFPLVDPDEARFARTTLEMQRSRDLLVPQFEGQPRLVKPPLMHWIQLAFFGWFGESEWVARLHSGLATLGSILIVGWVARRRFGEEGAFWAAACMTTLPLVVLLGRLGTLDALLALHVLAVVALDIGGTGEAARYRGLTIGALLGLGFLVKGPVGVVLPLLAMLAGRTAAGREILPSWVPAVQALAGWSVVVLPWGLAFAHRVGLDAVVATLRGEALERYFAGTTHVEPFWFYLPVLAVGLIPWTVPVALAMVRLVRRRGDPSARTALYAGAGLLAGVVFFSISKSKLPNYLLPLMPLAALLVAWEIGQELAEPRRRTLGPALTAGTLGALAVGLGVATLGGVEEGARTTAFAGAVIYAIGCIACLPALIRRRPRFVYATTAASAATFLLVVVLTLLPGLAHRRSAFDVVRAVPELASERPLVVVDMKVPSLTYYLDRIPEQVGMARFEQRLAATDDPLFVFDPVDLPSVPPGAMGRLRRVGGAGKYVVYEKSR